MELSFILSATSKIVLLTFSSNSDFNGYIKNEKGAIPQALRPIKIVKSLSGSSNRIYDAHEYYYVFKNDPGSQSTQQVGLPLLSSQPDELEIKLLCAKGVNITVYSHSSDGSCIRGSSSQNLVSSVSGGTKKNMFVWKDDDQWVCSR